MGVRKRKRRKNEATWTGADTEAAPGLDPDISAYFRKALETLEEGLSPDELALFSRNVLAEASSVGAAGVARTPWGSRVLEAALPSAPPETLALILPPLINASLRAPAAPPASSRALEAALERVRWVLGGGDVTEGPLDAILEEVERLAVAVTRDPVAYAGRPAGSYVVRALLRVLGGTPKAGTEGAELPPAFPRLLQGLAEAFEGQLSSLLAPASASLCLQGALEALQRSQSAASSRLSEALIGHLVPDGDEGALVRGLEDPERSRLLEAAMTASGANQLRALYRQHLKGRLLHLANHRIANHGLQRLLDHAPLDVLTEALEELGPNLGEALTSRHPGVLVAVAAAARRHPPLQRDALRHLLQAFSCWNPPERRSSCVTLIAGLRRYEDKGEESKEQPPLASTPLPASLLLQHLLHFGDPGPILKSFQNLPPSSLLPVALNPTGSRIWDSLLSSPTIPPRARQRLLLKHLQGNYTTLACHPNGSRVLDAVWAAASLPARAAIATELATHLPVLRRHPQGRRVAGTFGLPLFLRQRALWDRLQAAPSALGAILDQ